MCWDGWESSCQVSKEAFIERNAIQRLENQEEEQRWKRWKGEEKEEEEK